MQLPQTASLALAGPLEVPETNGGRAWLQVFDDDYDFIQVLHDSMSCLKTPQYISSKSFPPPSFLVQLLSFDGPGLDSWLSAYHALKPALNDHTAFPFRQPGPGEMRRTRSLKSTVKLLSELIRGLVASGWQARRIHLFGFSQGGWPLTLNQGHI